MPASAKKAELDLSEFPPASVHRYSKSLCLACIFDIFTKQLKIAPRTAYSEVKRHSLTVEEITGSAISRPYFQSEEKNPHCPYCNSAKRWHARIDAYRIEGGKATDAARRALVKSLPKADDQFQILEAKSAQQAIFFEWLDSMGREFDLDGEDWLVKAAQRYLERKHLKVAWTEVFEGIHAIRPSRTPDSEWQSENGRLYLTPPLYNEVLLVQYLVSRSHKAGGRTSEGRLTLAELSKRLRQVGFLTAHGITERDPFEVLEKLVEQLTGGESSLKLHYIIDRRDLLEKVKTVYARYAS